MLLASWLGLWQRVLLSLLKFKRPCGLDFFERKGIHMANGNGNSVEKTTVTTVTEGIAKLEVQFPYTATSVTNTNLKIGKGVAVAPTEPAKTDSCPPLVVKGGCWNQDKTIGLALLIVLTHIAVALLLAVFLGVKALVGSTPKTEVVAVQQASVSPVVVPAQAVVTTPAAVVNPAPSQVPVVPTVAQQVPTVPDATGRPPGWR